MSKDRIRIAEAMGWKKISASKHLPRVVTWVSPNGKREFRGESEGPRFYPFTSADDDYQVLDWMRKQDWYPDGLPKPMFTRPLHSYGVGDFARALLKAMKDHEIS